MRKPDLTLLVLGAALLAGATACQLEPIDATELSCAYEGKRYPIGASFPSTDGCNTCSCTASGEVACTLKACVGSDGGAVAPDAGHVVVDAPPSHGGCTYHDKHYLPGDRFPSTDGCNECACSEDGSGVSCTKKACFPDAGQGGVSDAGCVYKGEQMGFAAPFPAGDGCNTCKCGANGEVVCTRSACIDAGTGSGCMVDGKAVPPGTSFAGPTPCSKCVCDGNRTVSCSGPSTCQADAGAPVLCEYEGKQYRPGDGFSMGCNSCGCSADGKIYCTLIACPPPAYCVYGDHRYKDGESFPAGDGCNVCGCKGGQVICSKQACHQPDAGVSYDLCTYNGFDYPVGASFPKGGVGGCDRCTCYAGGKIDCQTGSCPDGGAEVCIVAEKEYVAGEIFGAGDGCNVCACGFGGNAYCTTRRVCTADAGAPVVCVYGDHKYEPGDTFLAKDGCNKCSCTKEGHVACTEVACWGATTPTTH